MLKHILIFLMASTFLSSVTLAQEDEIEKVRDEAKVLIRKGDIDAAISIYLPFMKGGDLFATDEITSAIHDTVSIYRNHKLDDNSTLIWCMVGLNYSKNLFESCVTEFSQKFSTSVVTLAHELAYQCIVSNFEACSESDNRWNEKVLQFSSTKCRVPNTPRATLKYKILPNGRNIGEIEKKALVTIMDESKDTRGKEWAFISSDDTKLNLGWILKKNVQCGL